MARRRQIEPSKTAPNRFKSSLGAAATTFLLRVVGAFISARAQIGNVIRQPTHVQPRELLDGRHFLDFGSMRMYLPGTWILRLSMSGIEVVPPRPRFAGIYLCRRILSNLLHSSAKATKQQHFRYCVQRLMNNILNLLRSLIQSLVCHLECYLVALIGLGGFQNNMRRTGIESHHSHSCDRITTRLRTVPTLRGTPTFASHFGHFYDWSHQVPSTLLSLSLACEYAKHGDQLLHYRD